MTKVSAQTYTWGCKRCIQLEKTLYRFLYFINRKYFTLILKMKTCLNNGTGKFCYWHENFQSTEGATGVALKCFTKFSGKRLCQSLRLVTLLKKRLRHRYSPVNFLKSLRTPFLQATVSQNMKACFYMIAAVHSCLIKSCSENIWKISRSISALDCNFH